MAKIVLAVVGENANSILERQSRRFLDLLPAYGLEGEILRLLDPGAPQRLADILTRGVLFAWGYAGVGSQLAIKGVSLWDDTKIPFISVLADAPYIMPRHHQGPSSYVVNGYIYQDWLDIQRAYIGSPQIADVIPHGVIPPAGAAAPLSRRPRRMVFVKTGADPAAIRARWSGWPVRLRPVLEDCASTLAHQGTGPIMPIMAACLHAHGLELGTNRAWLFAMLSELDAYARALRATAIARALLPLPADIIGDGWDHVREPGAAARFHPAIDADGLEALYAETQIVVNTTPNLATGAHERVLRGFMAGCRVLSDLNAFARDTLLALPGFHGVEWNDPDLAERCAAVFHDGAAWDGQLGAAQDYVARRHDPGAFLGRMIELAQLARMQDMAAPFALQAA